MSTVWNEEDLQILRDRFQSIESLDALAKQLGRTVGSITVKASRLGLYRTDYWSTADDDYLSSAYPTSSLDDVALHLNRSIKAVVSRAGVLGLKRASRARFSSKSRVNPKCGRGVLWTEDQLNALALEYATCPDLRSLSARLGKTVRAIGKRAQDLGIKRDTTKRLYHRTWAEHEDTHLRDHYSFGCIKSIASHLNRTPDAVTQRANVLGMTRDEETVRLQGRKHRINESFFKTWSSDMAYILGLICTDGNLSGSSNAVTICQHSKDKYILDAAMSAMDGDYVISLSRRVKDGRTVKMATLNVESLPIHRDLMALGLTPAKSLTLKCPAVPKEFAADFLRGVLDGDGTVSASKIMMRIATASKDFADGLNAMFAELGVESKTYDASYMYNGTKHAFYNVTVLKKTSIKRIYNLMYRDAKLYLKRKKQRFEDMGVLAPDFEVKCKERMRPVVGLANGVEAIRFDCVKAAKKSYPDLYRALKSGLEYKGYIWKYADKPTNNTPI